VQRPGLWSAIAAGLLVISDQDRQTSESWTRSSTISAGHRERAEIVLAIADGLGVSGTARALGVSRPTVIKWRDRFAAAGVDGLSDQPRSGRPKTIDDAQIIAATLERPPAHALVVQTVGPASSSAPAVNQLQTRDASGAGVLHPVQSRTSSIWSAGWKRKTWP
jgi:hypothetical protein